MNLVVKAFQLLWPSVVLAGIWLVAALVALWFARSTRRPVFLYSGLGVLLLALGEVISPLRVAFHYLKGTPIPGGTAGKVEVLVGAYKYQIAIEAIGALFFLVGLIREVMLARRRARARAAEAALAGGAPVGVNEPGTEGRVPPASPRRESERASLPSGRTGQGPAVESPLAAYAPTRGQAIPTRPGSESEQPCPRCRMMLSVDAQFCGNCGMQLEASGTPNFFDEEPTYRQDRTSAHSGGLRSREEFM